MSQKLRIPIDKAKMTAAYKNAAYRTRFGYTHYGVDMVSTTSNANVYALGDGEIIAAGMDGTTLIGSSSRLGNCIVVVYKEALCHDGKARNLACRMFHLDSIKCKKGDKVKAGQIIGIYGNTGANTTGAHLHIEFDTDIQYPQYAMGLAASGQIIKKGTSDSTVNPSLVWFLDEGQSMAISGDAYTSADDKQIPAMSTVSLEEVLARNAKLENAMAQIKAIAGQF